MPTGEIPNVDAQSSHIRPQLHLIGRPRTAVRTSIEITNEIAARVGPRRYSAVSIPGYDATEPKPPPQAEKTLHVRRAFALPVKLAPVNCRYQACEE
jgi:hypothetical protein